ncbi:zinc finger protein 397-like [Osmerus eperlanus]|uniref:zinc finger protein 397-like n=1 Tax=Osmerus eperlanus TaxID=29151 RepID=UPI002E1394F8
MSKLERLNARVARLLTVAVHEVLDVVKETVSEYQEKTARTLRENDSLKRRVQELQEQLKSESAAAPLLFPVSGGRAAVEKQQEDQTWSPSSRQDQTWSPSSRQDQTWSPSSKQDQTWNPSSRQPDATQEHTFIPTQEHTFIPTQEHTFIPTQEHTFIPTQEHTFIPTQEHYRKEQDVELVESECKFRLVVPEGLVVHPGVSPQLSEERQSLALPTPAPPTALRVIKTDVDTPSIRTLTTPSAPPISTLTTPSAPPISSSLLKAQLGLNLTVIKTEPETPECSTPPSAPLGDNRGVDLSCGSAGHDAAKSPASGAPYGLFYLHPSQPPAGRRFSFGRTGRAALDARRSRQMFRRDEPHVCFVCGKTFSRVGNLRIHQRCHTGEKPYGCLQCGRSFRQAGDLKKHKRVHTGEKPYYCQQCGKSFSRGENLKRHQKIHVGETLQLQQAWREHQTS